jgi:uncharacterized membrane protein YfcA
MALAAAGVGIVVGLTGMGGGALMTPVLVLLFGVPPLTAVSSDLGSVVHLRRGTVHLRLVAALCAGSVPAAFCGVLVARALGDGAGVQHVIQVALGIALLIAATGLTVRAYLRLLERARERDGVAAPLPQGRPTVQLRVWQTVAVGVVGGLVVGMTSVGSGSLIIIALMALYPGLRASELVGTDLVQAVPLVASAALGHVLFGDFSMELTLPLLVGSIPGVWLGARLSSSLPGGMVRRALAFVLLASALKLLGASTSLTALLLGLTLVLAPLLWMLARHRHGFPAIARGASGGAAQPAASPAGAEAGEQADEPASV